MPIALLALIGLAVEAVFLTRAPDHVFRAGGAASLFAGLFLVWFWLTVGWLLWFAARWCYSAGDDSPRRPGGRAVRLTVIGGTVLLALFYLASWGLFLQSGRFANLEVVRFVLVNPRMLVNYLVIAQPTDLLLVGVFAILLFFGLPFFFRWTARSQWKLPPTDDNPASSHRLFWMLTTVLLLCLDLTVGNDLSWQRRTLRQDALKHCLNPMIALAVTAVESLTEERIEPCLDESELEPISARQWTPPPNGKKPSVIVLLVEALRHDVVHLRHQGCEVTPNLNKLARNGLELTRAYAESTHSDYSDVCTVSSLYPLRTRQHHYYRQSDPWPKTIIYDALKPAGYATAIISSQNEAWGAIEKFLESPNLDLFYHPQRSNVASSTAWRDLGFAHERRMGTLVAGKFADSHTTDTAIDWIRRQTERERPFVLCMNFQSSHFPYPLPEGCDRPFQPCELDPDIMFLRYPKEKTHIVRNAYYNGLYECDRQLGRLVAALRELGRLDDTILVVTGDNGEAFHENGRVVGHAREPFEPAVHIACVYHGPKFINPAVEDYPFEHVDLVPTVFGLMGWPCHPNFQGIDVLSPERPPLDERLLFFHVSSPASRSEAVLLAGRWKFHLNHDTGGHSLFDLAADSNELHDVADRHPVLAERLRTVLSTWRERQLAYYHYPTYYQRYFPPVPPRWRDDSVVAR